MKRPFLRGTTRDALGNLALGALALVTLVLGSALILQILTAQRALVDELDDRPAQLRSGVDEGGA